MVCKVFALIDHIKRFKDIRIPPKTDWCTHNAIVSSLKLKSHFSLTTKSICNHSLNVRNNWKWIWTIYHIKTYLFLKTYWILLSNQTNKIFWSRDQDYCKYINFRYDCILQLLEDVVLLVLFVVLKHCVGTTQLFNTYLKYHYIFLTTGVKMWNEKVGHLSR